MRDNSGSPWTCSTPRSVRLTAGGLSVPSLILFNHQNMIIKPLLKKILISIDDQCEYQEAAEELLMETDHCLNTEKYDRLMLNTPRRQHHTACFVLEMSSIRSPFSSPSMSMACIRFVDQDLVSLFSQYIGIHIERGCNPHALWIGHTSFCNAHKNDNVVIIVILWKYYANTENNQALKVIQHQNWMQVRLHFLVVRYFSWVLIFVSRFYFFVVDHFV